MISRTVPSALAYRWSAGELTPAGSEASLDDGERLDAVDSFLVSDGRALAVGLHQQRFTNAVPEPARSSADAFFSAAVAVVPPTGEWFPRVQYGIRSGFTVTVRPAPAVARSIVLATHDGPDPRTQPTRKGPDLPALLAAREMARGRGADDAVILSPAGFVVEGATTSLLWWRGDTLCTPSADLVRMDGVTIGSVLALARALGVEVSWESATPADLDGLEVWALNSLHGIRIVTSWIDGPLTAEQPARLALWRARLDKLTRPLATLTA